MVTVAVAGAVPGLVAVKAGMSPVPLAVSPIPVLSLVHENEAPAPMELESGVSGTEVPLQ
jgi:hypothetical protein